MLKHLSLLTLVMFMALPADADPYRLIIGDRVIVNYDFLDEPKPTSVDLDGNIRLSEVGSIPAAGRTLDEIENAISEQMTLGGFSGVSFVLVEISEYAPVVVSGYVERSGRYEYLPGMDVSAALALAGGFGAGDIEGPNADVLAVNARRRASTAAERIAGAVADITRLDAALDGPDTPVELSDAMRAAVPVDLRDGMDARIEAEKERLAVRRSTADNLVASWNSDIADFEEQTLLLDERIVLKEDIVAQLAAELADLEKLRTQGLTTTARFSTQQQRLSDDREELLSLQTAKIAARRAATLAARNRDRFLSDRREEDLQEMKEARVDLESGLREYGFALDELTVLSDDTAALAEEVPVLDVRFVIRGPRSDRFGDAEVTINTPLLPGDIIVVEVDDPLSATR
ncbi:polysaccharide biosynthesis/export family protein [uncultured Tateyamaria sp.]|uniref:polysaccharide biosynthesis/export family protein n=1 Tax=Tateyamaria sp. 1078 TaxID=3417464 RepID=UPI002636D1A5|nr:polysaccharide biosynthesis/export family protein [uncultured Tateyamaria sp.]